MKREIYLSSLTMIYHEQSDMLHVLMTYVFPVLACSAIIGNTVFVASIFTNEYRKKTTGILLGFSGIASIILTVSSSLSVYFPWIFEKRESGTKTPCNILVFSYHFSALWSAYLLSSACVERYIAICHPMSKYVIVSSKSVLKQSLKFIIGTFLVACILCSPLIWFSGLNVIEELPNHGNITFCYYDNQNWYMEIHEYAELTFYAVIPFFVISFCNIAIIRKIYFHRLTLGGFNSSSTDCSVNTEGRREYLPHRSQTVKLASILLPISILYLLFSVLVVLSVILEDTVAKLARDKLLLLTLSYNATQLQAGFYFYINIALSSAYRHSLKNSCFRKEINTRSQYSVQSY